MQLTSTSRLLCLPLLVAFCVIAGNFLAAKEIKKIEWNAKNKVQGRQVHELVTRIYKGDLDPKQMIADLGSLGNLLTDSSFAEVPGIGDFQVIARAIYAWRTANVKLGRGERFQHQTTTGTEISTGTTIVGPAVHVDADFRRLVNELKSRATQEKIETQSDGHKIEELREALHQSYQILLKSLADRGFAPPVNEGEIVGAWTWRGSNADYTFTFNKDGSMKAKIHADKPEKLRGAGWVDQGRGIWKVDYNRLYVRMDQVWIGLGVGFWKDQRIKYLDDEVKSVSTNVIVLDREENNELKRIKDH